MIRSTQRTQLGATARNAAMAVAGSATMRRESASHGMSKGMTVTLLRIVLIAAGLAAANVLMAACTNSHPAAEPSRAPSLSRASSAPTVAVTSTSPSRGPSRRAPRPSRQEVLSAVSTVRQYLHAWVTEGPSRASRYLVASQRTTSDQGAPRIGAGMVRSYRLDSWKGPKEFTLYVSMDLTFTNDPMAWNRGINDRFVTAHRVRDHGYLLEFATSP